MQTRFSATTSRCVAAACVLLTCTAWALAYNAPQNSEPTTAPANLIRTSVAPDASAPPPASLDLPRVIASLAIVIGCILILRWAARRFLRLPSAGRASDAVKVLSRTPISPRQHVLALQVGRRVLIIADNGQQLSTLCEVTDERELAEFTGRSSGEASEGAADEVVVEQPQLRPSSPRQEIQGLLNKVRGLAQQFK